MKWLKNLFEAYQRHWRRQQRAHDVKILWPAMKEVAALQRAEDPLRLARKMFMIHASTNELWTADFTDEELALFVLTELH